MPRRKRTPSPSETVKRRRADESAMRRRALLAKRRARHMQRLQRRPPRPPPPPPPPPPPSQYFIRPRPLSFTRPYEEVATAPFLPQGTVPPIVEFYCSDIFRLKNAFYRNLDTVFPSFCDVNADSGYFADLRTYLIRWSLLLMRARRAFRALATRIIRRRCERIPLELTDAITLSPIREPIILYDMPNRGRYTFEAQSLLQHIVSQLLHHVGGFPGSQLPRNPLTNMFFTFPQLISVHNQLLSYGRMHWAMAAFASVQYRFQSFVTLFEPAIRLAAIRQHVFMDYEGTIEEISDFVSVWTEFNGTVLSQYDFEVFEHALRVNPNHTYLLCWRRLYMRALAADLAHAPHPVDRELPHVANQRKSLRLYTLLLTKNMRLFLNECAKPAPSLLALIMGQEGEDEDEEEDY